MKNVDGPAVGLVDEADAELAGVPAELAGTLTDIPAACREGLMAVAVEAGLATAMVIMADGGRQVSKAEAVPCLHRWPLPSHKRFGMGQSTFRHRQTSCT